MRPVCHATCQCGVLGVGEEGMRACVELGLRWRTGEGGLRWRTGEGGQGRALARQVQGTGQGGMGVGASDMGCDAQAMGTWVVAGRVGTWHGRVLACQGIGASGAGCGARGMGHRVALWRIGVGTSVELKR